MMLLYKGQSKRLSLFGHIARMPDETDAKQILTAYPAGNWRRPLGRPRIIWMKTIQQDLKSSDLNLRSVLRTLIGACQK